MVTREPEWTDHELAKLEALAEYEAGLCDCGFHRSQTKPGVHHYKISERVCPVCASSAQYERVQQDADQKTVKSMGDNRPPAARVPTDGRKTLVGRTAPPPLVAQ